jgi:hypothetical protein
MITWLASYPKSGNTWVRLFLDAYVLDTIPDINKIYSTRADQHSKHYNIGDFKIEDIPLEQQILARGFMLLNLDRNLGCGYVNDEDGTPLPLIVKTHMANVTVNDVKTIPSIITDKVIYLYRDPRKVVISYAKHMGLTLDETIDIMISKDQASWDGEDADRLPQHMSSWLVNTQSYMTATDLKVYALKYEEIIENPEVNFEFMLKALGIPIDKKRLQKAIDNCSIDNLRKQEKEKGFIEKNTKTEYSFFGDKQKLELTQEQENRLVEGCMPMIETLGYI